MTMTPYLATFIALLSVGSQVASFSIPPPRFARSISITTPNKHPPPTTRSSFNTSPAARAPAKATSTALEALPNWALYSLSHIIGGTAGTPTVMKASKSWYKRLPKPSWTPPNFVFGPTWATLYGLMGYSVSRIVASGSPSTRLATKLWAFHYALNILWAQIFFGFRNLRAGLVINFGLLGTLGFVLPLFRSIDPLSAYLQIPYVMWLLYATKLNQTICKLNPMLGGTNKAKILADLHASGDGDGYNDAMLDYDIKMLQAAAAKYAGL